MQERQSPIGQKKTLKERQASRWSERLIGRKKKKTDRQTEEKVITQIISPLNRVTVDVQPYFDTRYSILKFDYFFF